MKIGILTHHYVKNYGAFLQMKGMYETLQRLYPEAEVTVINYVNQKHWRRNILHILHFRPEIDTLSTYVEKIRQLRTFTKYERSIPRTRPVKTAKEAVLYARQRGYDMVFLDTAGRLHVDEQLMEELKRKEKLVRTVESSKMWKAYRHVKKI